jgi:hypothetical protein
LRPIPACTPRSRVQDAQDRPDDCSREQPTICGVIAKRFAERPREFFERALTAFDAGGPGGR